MTAHAYFKFALGLKAAKFSLMSSKTFFCRRIILKRLEPSIAFCENIGILTLRHAELPLAAAVLLDLNIKYNYEKCMSLNSVN